MMLYTPKVGRLIALEGVSSPEDLEYLGARALSALKERGASEIMAHILNDCTTTKREKRYGIEHDTFSIRAIVMTEEEFRKSLEEAYFAGRRDGVRP